MRKLKILNTVLGLFLFFMISANSFAEIVYPVKKVENIEAYGNPLYKGWGETTAGVEFLDSKTYWDSLSREQTEFSAVYGQGKICFLFIAELSTTNRPAYIKGLKRDGKGFFSGDDIEFFLIPGGKPLHQFAILPDGAVFDSQKGSASWNANNLKVKSLLKNKKWLVTFTLPFSDLKIQNPKALEQWRFNVCRTWTDASRRQHYSSWSKLKKNGYHSPECFSKLVFSAKSSVSSGKVSHYEHNWIKNSNLDLKSKRGPFPAGWIIYPGTEYTEKYKYDKNHLVISTNKGKVISVQTDRLIEPERKLRIEFDAGGEAAYKLRFQYLDTNGKSIVDKIERKSNGPARKITLLRTPPTNAAVLKQIYFINCSNARLTLDNIYFSPESKEDEFIVGQAPDMPDLIGEELTYLDGFQWGAPPQDKLRILYVAQGENYIISRIVKDLSRQLGMTCDLIQGQGAEEPMEISDRVKAGKYGAIFYQGDFFAKAPKALKKLVKNGLSLLVIKPYSAGRGRGKIIFKRGKKRQNFPALQNVPLEQISPDRPELKWFGINTIHSSEFGRGKVIEIECAARQFYRHGLLPAVDEMFLSHKGVDIDNELNFDWWNYYYSLYGQCLRWLAGYSPDLEINFDSAEVVFKPGDNLKFTVSSKAGSRGKISAVLFRNSREIKKYQIKTLKLATATEKELTYNLSKKLQGGRYFLNWQLMNSKSKVLNWGTRCFKIIPESGPAIKAVTVPDVNIIPENGIKCLLRLKGKVSAETSFKWLIHDAENRLIAKGARELSANADNKVDFTAGINPQMILSPYARITVILYNKEKATDSIAQDIYFKISKDEKLKDYVLAAYTWIPLHYRPLAFKLLRKVGINTINCWPNGSFKALKEGFQWLDAWGGLMAHGGKIIGAVQERHKKITSPEDKHLQDFSLNDPAFKGYLKDNVDKYCHAVRRNAPLGYFLCDEMTLAAPWAGLARAEPARDKYTLNAYRSYLKAKYKDISTLNRQWNSNWTDFVSIVPPFTKDARKMANFPSWIEFRLFMDTCFSQAGKVFAAEATMRIPELKSGQPNFTYEGPFTGIDPYKLATSRTGALSYGMDEFNRSFKKNGTTVWNWNCYSYSSWEEMRGNFWSRLFHGSSGTSIFGIWFRSENARWGFLHPQLGLTERALTLKKAFHELVSGPGRLIINTPRMKPETVFLFSQPSMHMSWLESKDQISFSHSLRSKPDADSYVSFFRSRKGFETLVQNMFMQYDYRISSQIQNGALKDRKILVMPMCIGIDQKTATVIEKWQRKGGIVIADIRTFARDELGNPLDPKYLKNIFGIERKSLPSYKPQAIKVSTYGNATVQAGAKVSLNRQTKVLSCFSDGKPAIIVHRNGKGTGIYLNFVAKNSVSLRNIFARLLTNLGIKRPVRLLKGAEEAHGYEVFKFKRAGDASEYIGIHRGDKESSDGKLTLRLAEKNHIFNVFSKKYLGFAAKVSLQIPAKGAMLLAASNFKPSDIQISIPGKVKRGNIVKAKAKITGKGRVGYQVFSIKLFSPSKKILNQYSRNVDVQNGNWEGILPIAFNAKTGIYYLQITDAATGIQKKVPFKVMN